jgi:transglutaminase-like putative cysteine protease
VPLRTAYDVAASIPRAARAGLAEYGAVMRPASPLAFAACLFALAPLAAAQIPVAPALSTPSPAEIPTAPAVYTVRQTVSLKDVPEGAKTVKAWIAFPGDAASQKLLDFSAVDIPGTWKLATEPKYGNRFLYVEAPAVAGEMKFVLDVAVRREPVAIRLGDGPTPPLTAAHRTLFARELDPSAPLMEVDDRIRKLADGACAGLSDVVAEARAIYHLTADLADHYSKDPSKPKCGRGAAGDCLAQSGGCCTDLHSLFVAAARARGIPTRMVFGYRVLDKNIGKEVDPGYRCWVEFFAPGKGWVPLDVVEGDALSKDRREAWFGRLTEQRLYCCEGRDMTLEPRQAGGPVNTMIIGHFEIDGTAVPVLPSADGKPSPLSRTIRFTKTPVDPR